MSHLGLDLHLSLLRLQKHGTVSNLMLREPLQVFLIEGYSWSFNSLGEEHDSLLGWTNLLSLFEGNVFIIHLRFSVIIELALLMADVVTHCLSAADGLGLQQLLISHHVVL